jgi:hypothetical protein
MGFLSSKTRRAGRARAGRRVRASWFAGLALVIGNAALLTALAEETPSSLFVGADVALRDADRAEAPRHTPDLYAIAERLRDVARREYASEASRFLWFRDYAGVRSCLAASRLVAGAAEGKATRARGAALGSLRERLDVVGQQIDLASGRMDGLPTRGGSKRALSRSEMLFHRAVEAHRGGDLVRSAALLNEAEKVLGEAQVGFDRELQASLANAPAWARWARAAIVGSRDGGGSMILVDKMRHRCYLYRGGRAVKSYDVELGPHWLGNKERSGDKRTPEGVYKVMQKKAGPSTKYHKALLINYPNDDDRRRFSAARKAGLVPRGAGIGGLIEIHGDGGRGYDWTLGCVALVNREMDDLYERVSVGTPVVIVGTLPDDLARGD